ncbi:MAG: hypothetical protein WCG49_02000 [Actinomycetes bacterium]
MSLITAVVVGGSAEPWEAFGFHLLSATSSESRFSLGDVVLVVDSTLPAGMVSWEISDIDAGVVDAIPTARAMNTLSLPLPQGRVGCLGVDHVVVRTNSLDITCAAITAATGAPVKRIRDAGSGMQQAFHKLGSVVVEVVSAQEQVEHTHLWGFVVNVSDIDALSAFLVPDILGTPKPATQPGRRIASARSGAALGVPFAVMDLGVAVAG